MDTRQHIRIGVFVPEQVQFLDVSPIDLFAMLDPTYLEACQLPAAIVKLGTPSTIHYISVPENGGHVALTASAFLQITKSIEDPEVQPGKLDIILVPGPNPSSIINAKALEFLRRHAAWRGDNGYSTDILSVCTGVIALCQSSLLKGKQASGPRGLVPTLRKNFPDVNWVDNKRWVQDGNIWSSGGITNGQEMVAQYIRVNFPGPATEAALAMADVGEKGINYTSGKASETVWWLWQILKAFTGGNGKRKSI